MSPEFRADDLDRLRSVERDVGELKVETAKQSVVLDRIDQRLARRDRFAAGIVGTVIAGVLLAWLASHQPTAHADNRTPQAEVASP